MFYINEKISHFFNSCLKLNLTISNKKKSKYYYIIKIYIVSPNNPEKYRIINYKKSISLYFLQIFNKFYHKIKTLLVLLLFILFSLIKKFKWSYFTTWASSIYLTEPPNIKLSYNSIRQIIRVSSSGKYLRFKFSNKIGKTNLEIKGVTIADSLSQGTGEINIKTIKNILFKGEKSIYLPPGMEKYSDLISYPLKALSEIAISIYFGETPVSLTGHPLSIAFSFIEKGNKIYNKKIKREYKIAHWYFISSIEIFSYSPKKTIVCFGDSITDGAGSTFDRHNSWPDLLSEKLNLNRISSNFAVINKGIEGASLNNQGLKRFSYDVLEVKGVSHIIILFGFNDIYGMHKNSSIIISSYKKIIKEAHKNHIFIFAGTILPCGKFYKWDKGKEKFRQEINYWIRNTKSEEGGFDSYFDFDKYISDPNDMTKIYSAYDSGDGVHPNYKGHKRMFKAIRNLKIFKKDFIE